LACSGVSCASASPAAAMLELAGSAVQIADALKVKGLAPLACKTDRIGAWVLARCPAAI
jgi:hypothetical protein